MVLIYVSVHIHDSSTVVWKYFVGKNFLWTAANCALGSALVGNLIYSTWFLVWCLVTPSMHRCLSIRDYKCRGTSFNRWSRVHPTFIRLSVHLVCDGSLLSMVYCRGSLAVYLISNKKLIAS